LQGEVVPKFLIDECLSPDLALLARERGFSESSHVTWLGTLAAITAAVPVRLMKRDLAFIVEALLPLMDEPRLAMIARNRGIRSKEGESVGRMLAGVLRKADESELSRAMVEIVILLSARSQSDSGKVLRTAAQTYKVDTDAIAIKVKQEFAAKEKVKKPVKAFVTKQTAKGKRAAGLSEAVTKLADRLSILRPASHRSYGIRDRRA
jgi:hypothetical protein